MEKIHVNQANTVSRIKRRSWRVELKSAIDRIKANWRAATGRREMMKLGSHLLQDLGLNAKGRPLDKMHSGTRIGESRGCCEGQTYVTPVWCDCKMT